MVARVTVVARLAVVTVVVVAARGGVKVEAVMAGAVRGAVRAAVRVEAKVVARVGMQVAMAVRLEELAGYTVAAIVVAGDQEVAVMAA